MTAICSCHFWVSVIGEGERGDRLAKIIAPEVAADGWCGTGKALRAVTEAAGNPHRRGTFLLEGIGIDELAGVMFGARQCNGPRHPEGAMGTTSCGDGAGHGQKTRAIGKFDLLHEDSAGLLERGMHIPQGAGPAMAGEGKARSIEAL